MNDVVAAPAHPARGGLRAGTKVAAIYGNHMLVGLFPEGAKVRMVITDDAHRDSAWTERATAGMTSQLRELPAAFARRRA